MTNVKDLRDEQRPVFGKGSPFYMVLIKRFTTYNKFLWLHGLGAVKKKPLTQEMTSLVFAWLYFHHSHAHLQHYNQL